MYYVYFLKSVKNGKYYTGVTAKDPHVRLIEHNQGANRWTRNNKPFTLIYFEEYVCQQDAEKREKFYKTGIGRKVRDLIITAVFAKGEQ